MMKPEVSISLTLKRTSDEETTASDDVTASERIEFRKRVQDAIEKMELEFDKALLALHPLGITVSAALYNQLIASKIPIGSQWCIFSAWIFWILGITSTLVSFRTSVISNRRNLDRFDEETLDHSNYKDAWSDCATTSLTWGSMFCFVLGVVFAAAFLLLQASSPLP
jgi:hypothetical protein